jgi:hypothetical protein
MTPAPATYLPKLAALSPEQRLHLFEVLAHNLTVEVRAVWSDAALSAEDKVESMKQFNECLHRVTARVWVQRLQTHTWTDEDFLALLAETDSQLHPRVRGGVAAALALSYAAIAN